MSREPDLAGKTAFVTGASRGIGAAAARHLAACGARVTLAARGEEETGRIAGEIRAAGGKAETVRCDVAEFGSVAEAVGKAAGESGSLDILVNNAGLIEPVALIASSDPAEWGRTVDVNLKGVYHGVRAALPGMLARGAGTIVNLGSGAAVKAYEGWSHYCAAKAAVLALTRCIDAEYRGHGIRALGLSPGTVATGMQESIRASGVNPVSRLDWSAHIPPEAVARAIGWLCTPAADPHRGTDFSLRTVEGRKAAGLPVEGATA